ncbi:hypothetical protein CHGG_02562 [Chaetomium globosum CBS 148.51]|uniref:Ilp is an apoptosis inhibitor n=1 Tax=Chaetomium globosum (strain ATCC 6205 / CBS 148.51 / DSM 1962 / NBRC 6347 / NRRL 1970) TaxID=306901 RepID=Q2HB42_CHAGB|nr:uncharacterized protein CHGG_02562 [Chaetomium globosum CBS 148.51]EAQ90627.1 hypothetical protein CHGG_02562 [Chaetomium globosum CBS 148.51]
MAAAPGGGGHHPFQGQQSFVDDQFDLFDWHPYFLSCVRYFVDHAQYNGPVQALAAFINIQLPFQRAQTQPTVPLRGPPNPSGAASQSHHHHQQPVSLQPYLRRLVATGFDIPPVLHGFFGDDWKLGLAPLHEQERRNFLFAAKSASWLEVKRAYDMGPDEALPFLKPLRNVTEAEIVNAEAGWSEWLAMQDW